MYSLFKTSRYKKQEKLYAPAFGKRLQKMERALKKDPVTQTSSITLLTDHEPPYRYRIGDYRIFYDVDVQAATVILQYIKPRGEAYKK